MARAEKTARRRVSRREAAKILRTSYENVRRLQRQQLLNGVPDEHGHYWFDREEVEALARKRNASAVLDGELTARVFAMIKAGKTVNEIVIGTRETLPTVERLWDAYHQRVDSKKVAEDRETQALREHEEQMRALDAEIERRRRLVVEEGEPPPSHRGGQKKGPRK